jgi:hypothetical protein
MARTKLTESVSKAAREAASKDWRHGIMLRFIVDIFVDEHHVLDKILLEKVF